jgi:asparagine synthase (glutamine-hydrolysing)
MCGVAGALAAQPDTRVGAVTTRLTRALAHRGPDGEGFWSSALPDRRADGADALRRPAAIAVGHRRLAIVDVAGGAQPMASENDSVWVSFNGELYNHLELREELERAGHRFSTRSDTEVLVHGWEEWGEALFGRLNGIFAFSLVDMRRETVLLVRDPVGVKPMYVGIDRGLTWWASELQAAQDAGVPVGSVSPDALKLFLTFRFVPSPRTLFERAWKIPPGHFVRLEPQRAGTPPEFTSFATTISSPTRPGTADEWQAALLGELEDAVTRQLMSDVPVASLLSGGVDSTLLTQMMAQSLPAAPETFGIGFSSDGVHSEAAAARWAAESLGVPHHTTNVGDDEYVAEWPRALARIGEPVANSGALLVRLICADVGRTHKVVLSGQGADEPLGGYPRHLIERLHGLGRRVPTAARFVARHSFGTEDAARLQRALNAEDRIARYVEIFSVLPASHVDELVEGASASAMELAREAVERWTSADKPTDSLNELLRVDARMSLADDLLEIADHFSMRCSVELRVPFLDLRFLELAERMPSRFKISALGSRKWLYRRGAERRLPAELRRSIRPRRLSRKRGFSTPRSWFDVGADALSPVQARSLAMLPFRRGTADDLVAAEGPRRRSLLYALAAWAESHAELLGS